MKRVFVDFGRAIGDDVRLLLTSRANTRVTVEEVVAHYGPNVIGVSHWSAIADWATQRDTVAAPDNIAVPAQP